MFHGTKVKLTKWDSYEHDMCNTYIDMLCLQISSKFLKTITPLLYSSNKAVISMFYFVQQISIELWIWP